MEQIVTQLREIAAPSSIWNVEHNLATQEFAVDCMVNVPGSPVTVEKTIPLSIVAISSLELEITWPSPESGYVRIVANINI